MLISTTERRSIAESFCRIRSRNAPILEEQHSIIAVLVLVRTNTIMTYTIVRSIRTYVCVDYIRLPTRRNVKKLFFSPNPTTMESRRETTSIFFTNNNNADCIFILDLIRINICIIISLYEYYYFTILRYT